MGNIKLLQDFIKEEVDVINDYDSDEDVITYTDYIANELNDNMLENSKLQTLKSNCVQFHNVYIDERILSRLDNDDNKIVNAFKTIRFVGMTKNSDTIFMMKNGDDEILISLLYNTDNVLYLYEGEYIPHEDVEDIKKSLRDDIDKINKDMKILEDKLQENIESMKLVLDDDMVNTIGKYITKIKKSTYDKEQEAKILEDKKLNFEKAIEVDVIDI